MHRFKGKLPPYALRTAGLVAILAALVAVVAVSSAGAKTGKTSAGTVVFMSTQLTPVTEQQKFIDVTLKGFPGSVQFVPANAPSDLVTRLNAEAQAGNGQVSLVGKVAGKPTGDGHDTALRFRLRDRDGTASVPIVYRGSVPDLFRTGREVVVDGTLRDGTFVAERNSLVTKCPSKYAPKKT